MRYMYNPPLLIKKVFSNYYWNTTNNKILLTIDDGPLLKNTETILTLLNNYQIKALFFVVGGNCVKNPSLINEIIAEGHEIGNHTFNHRIPAKISSSELNNEIDQLNAFINETFNYKIKYFRPPHGRFSLGLEGILQKKEMRNVMWSLLTFDYKNDYKLVKFAIEKYLTNNSIVVLHDSLKSKNIIADSIKYLLEHSSKLGYQFGETKECLK